MESTWRRAWDDTEKFRHSPGSFWGLEIVGAAVLGFGGGFVGFLLTPIDSSRLEQYVYPAIGSIAGIIIGLIVVFCIIYVFNLFRAPYRQRNEQYLHYEKMRKKLDDYERKELEVIVKDNDPNYVMVAGDRYKLRVGIRALGKRTIHNVQVDLHKIDGSRTPHANPQLFPSESQGTMSPCFDVNPSDDSDKFVDLLSWDKGDEYMRIHYFKNYKLEYEISLKSGITADQIYRLQSMEIPPPITAESHVLTLRVSGNDCNEIYQDVIIGIGENGGLELHTI